MKRYNPGNKELELDLKVAAFVGNQSSLLFRPPSHACIHTHTHLHPHTQMHTHSHAHTFLHTHTCIHTPMHTHSFTHACRHEIRLLHRLFVVEVFSSSLKQRLGLDWKEINGALPIIYCNHVICDDMRKQEADDQWGEGHGEKPNKTQLDTL